MAGVDNNLWISGLWWIYNSKILESFIGLATLGSIGITVNYSIKVGKQLEVPSGGMKNNPYLDVKVDRTTVAWLAPTSIILNLATVVIYFTVYVLNKAKTEEELVPGTAPLVLLLILTTILSAIFLLFLYIKTEGVLRAQDKLRGG